MASTKPSKKLAKPKQRATKAGSGPSAAAAKRKLFADAYMANGGNATQAAIAAGLSPKTAGQTGARMLKHAEVAARVAQLQQKVAEKFELNTERVLQELSRLAFFDIRKLVDNTGKPKALADLDDDTAAAIVGLDLVQFGNKDSGIGDVLKFKLADKKGALDLAMRHLGLLKDKVEVTGKDGAPLEESPNQLARRVAFILAQGMKQTKGA
jgi:phage terminase small subunit